MTLRTYSETWLRIAASRYRRQTVTGYKSALAHHVLPTLGDVDLAALTRVQIRGWLLGLLGGGMAPQGVRFCLTTLSSVLTAAVDQEIIAANMAHGAAKRLRLRHRDNPHLAFTPVELRLFFQAGRTIVPRFVDFFELLLLTGCRIGEGLGLQAGDFDEVARSLRIARSYAGGGFIGPTKSGETRHVVDLSPRACVILARRADQARPPERWLFASAWGDWPYNPGTLQKIASELVTAAGLRKGIGPHGFRHTFGSMLISAGESPERVRRLLGHRDIGTTIHTYGDHFDFPANGALHRLDALLANGEAPHPVGNPRRRRDP